MVSLNSLRSFVSLTILVKPYEKISFIQSLLKNQIYKEARNDQMKCNYQK
jgi:hypothetical protein